MSDMESEEFSTAMDVPELIPMEDYDSKQARLEASISWLVTKAYGRNIPKDFREQFYIDKHNEQTLKPCVVNSLTTAEIYCRACANIFKDSTHKWDGHSSVIQALSRKGIYVMDPYESAVTDSVLKQNAPVKLHSHLALIDSLMTAYATETVTIERVVQAVRKFATFNASSELPYDTEDALLFWINKVCSTVRQRLQKAQGAGHGIPVMDDILKDINDGCCLATLCSFYCPRTLSLHDIALKDDCGVADSMYNLQLVIQFCESLPTKCLHLSLNDLFYSQEDTKRNIIVFLSELFFWFEVSPAPIVANVTRQEVARPNTSVIPSEGEVDDGGRPSTAKQLASRPPLPISAATKRSFHQSEVSSSSTPDLHKAANAGSQIPPKHNPLLPKRQIPMSPMDTSENVDDDDAVRQSQRAWEDASEGEPGLPGARRGVGEPQRAMASSSRTSQLTNVTRDSHQSDLLNNVSIDSSMSIDMGASTSIDVSDYEDSPRKTPVGPVQRPKSHVGGPAQNRGGSAQGRPPTGGSAHGRGTLGAPVRNPRTPQHATDMDLESVGSNSSRATTAASTRRGGEEVEPLMPAQLKPSKEKSSVHTKEVESGEKLDKKSPSTPTRPPKTLPIKQPMRQVPLVDSDSDSTPSEEYQTPSVESVPLPGTMNESPKRLRNANAQHAAPEPNPTGTSQSRDTLPSSRAGSTFDRNNPLSQSFTVHSHPKHPKTPEEAEAAGIPVVDDYRFNRQHPGSYLRGERSDRSSSEGSDPELRKINADHKDREHKVGAPASRSPPGAGAATTEAQRPASLNVTKRARPGQKFAEKPSPKTSFAQLKKENGDVAGSLYGESDVESKPAATGSLKDQFQKSKVRGVKKTTFAALPNQTSWTETAKKTTNSQESNANNDDNAQLNTSELVNIRMRLEERRKQIETDKKRMEMQWNKQRQRVGKQAFIQVISKGKSTESSPSDSKPPEEPKMMVRSAEETKTVPQPVSKVSPRRGSEDVMSRSANQELLSRSAEGTSQSKHSRSQSAGTKRAEPRKAEPAKAAPSHHEQTPPKSTMGSSTERLQERLRSESPQSRAGQRASSSSPSPVPHQHQQPQPQQPHHQQQEPQQQEFSRAHIQNKIDSVRRRWFPDGPAEEGDEADTSRVKTAEPPSLAVEQPFQQIQGSPLKRPPVEVPPVEEYGSSLDRLNGSLTELQGEIMRLSLQHDQIKSIVQEPHLPPTRGLPEKSKPSESNDQFYLFPRGAGEPDVESERQSDSEPERARSSPEPEPADVAHMDPAPPPPAAPVQSAPHTAPPASQPMYQSPGQPAMYPNQPYPGYPHMAPGQYPQYPTGMYPQQYPGMPPQGPFQASPSMYPQAQMYPPGHPMHGYPMYPQGQWQQPMPGVPPVSVMPPQSLMLPQAHTQTVSSHQGLPVQSPVAVTSPERTVQPPPAMSSSFSSPPASHPPAPAHSTPQSRASPSPGTPQSQSQRPGSVTSPLVKSPPAPEPEREKSWDRPPAADQLPYDYAEEPQDDDPMNQSNEGFFVQFDDDPPRRQKPKLKPASERKTPQGKGTPGSGERAKPPVAAPAPAPPPQPVEPPQEVAPGVGFVIGQDEQKAPVIDQLQSEQAEIEKKKQRLMQIQMKRREESERKKTKLEAERAKKREEQRMKEETADAKKAEDKARRDQIFQSYQQRKADRAAEEEMSKAGMAPVKRRLKAKAARPKSQPPGTMAIHDDGQSHSSHSHSSQEEIHTRGRSPAPELTRSFLDPRKKRHSTGHLMSLPSGGGGGDKVDSSFQLAYGGLTHRRPPTPDRLKGLGGETDGNGNGPHRAGEQDYAGPKLFVKPSQKSNKHIVVNAVSHCCLAGTVNEEVKNKVLDIIERAEAKHFLILFRNAGQQYRGIYTYNPDNEEVVKIQGVGPKQIFPNMFEKFYKYNSGAKSFTMISTTKHLSQTIDAVTIPNTLWQKKPAQAPKKPMY